MRLRIPFELSLIPVFAYTVSPPVVDVAVVAIIVIGDIAYNLRSSRRRAYRLLMEHLTFRQRWRFRLTGTLRIIGSDGHVYWVLNLATGNVRDRTMGSGWCGAPQRHVPLLDRVLGTKLLLEADAAHYKRKAYPG